MTAREGKDLEYLKGKFDSLCENQEKHNVMVVETLKALTERLEKNNESIMQSLREEQKSDAEKFDQLNVVIFGNAEIKGISERLKTLERFDKSLLKAVGIGFFVIGSVITMVWDWIVQHWNQLFHK